MLHKLFKSSFSPKFAVDRANAFIRDIYEKGYEVKKVRIRQLIKSNGEISDYRLYKVMIDFEYEKEPKLRKIEFISTIQSRDFARKLLEEKVNNQYVNIHMYECDLENDQIEVSGVALF